MKTLVLDALVQPPREAGHHLLKHLARYGMHFPLNCILQLKNISLLVDVHFFFEVPPTKRNRKVTGLEREGGGGLRHITSVGDELPFP